MEFHQTHILHQIGSVWKCLKYSVNKKYSETSGFNSGHKWEEGGGEGVSTPEGLRMSQVSYILPISSSEVTYKVVTSSGVRGNYKLFSPHDFW